MKSLSILLFLLFFGCHQKNNTKTTASRLDCHKNFSARELEQDLDVLAISLQDIHPGFYRVTDKQTIDRKIEEIKNSLTDSVSYLQFLKQVAILLTDVGCANTQWGHSKDFIRYRNKHIKLFPLEFKIDSNQFIVSKNYSNNLQIKRGDKIIAINGETTKDYLLKNYELLPVDGKVRSLQHRWLESYFPNHHANFWEQADTFLLNILKKDGSESELKVAARYKSELAEIKQKEKIKSNSPFLFTIIDSIAFVKVSSFHSAYLKSKKQDLALFLDSSFSKIQKLNLTLVLDVRNNSWGDFRNATLLMEYLSDSTFGIAISLPKMARESYYYSNHIDTPATWVKPKFYKNKIRTSAYHKDLYIISNGWNVDAGGLFCARAAQRDNTYFLEEKPGMSFTGIHYNPVHLTLPNTGINVYIPTEELSLLGKGDKSIKGIQLTDLNTIPTTIKNAIKLYHLKTDNN